MRAGRAAVWLLLVAGCGGDSESDRDGLYRVINGGTVQREHGWAGVRRGETSLRTDLLPLGVWHALRERIDQAELDVVTRCLEQVRTYNACFTELPCEAFEDRRQPAWLSGIELAPCGCGVAGYAPEPGWIVRRAVLPENLSACEGVLPLQGAPPTPDFACP